MFTCGEYCQPVSVFSEIYFSQNGFQKRFQERSPNYREGETITELIPLDSIDTVPVALLVAKNDMSCTHEQAMVIADTIGD